jgi:transcriptional regulator with XRE-family HTH domain
MPVDYQKIKTLREKKGWTQEEAAKAAGFKSRQSWHQVESGDHVPRLDTLEKIADALGVKAKDLLK